MNAAELLAERYGSSSELESERYTLTEKGHAALGAPAQAHSARVPVQRRIRRRDPMFWLTPAGLAVLEMAR